MTNDDFRAFSPAMFRFLEQLKRNNKREWFQKNKARYEAEILQPSLAFIRSFEPLLKKISPHYLAKASRVGGSLMRIYRDTRFSEDKSPYKTNVGIHFRHELCGDVHAPGFYLHLEPQECFLGVGVWRPDSKSLAMIREAIDAEPARWRRARDNKRFRAKFDLSGDSLKTAPRGYAPDHPLLDDLKRKDFTAILRLSRDEVTGGGFHKEVAALFSLSRPFMRFICDGLQLPF